MISERNWKFSASPICSSLPLSRTQLMEEVFVAKSFGQIDAVYLSRGHIFVLLAGRTKLITFDTKSADHIQEDEQKGFLDIEAEFPITAIIGLPSNAVYTVQQNGLLQHWQYKADYTWKCVSENYICIYQSAEVTDVCLNVAQNALYWCERRVSETSERPIYCICKSLMNDREDKLKVRGHENSQTLIQNCPKSNIYPMGHGVLVVTRADPPAVSVSLLLCTLTGKIEVIVGDERIVSEFTTHATVDFKHIIMSWFSIINKTRTRPPVVCSKYFQATQTLVQVLSDGQILCVSYEKSNKRKSVQLEGFQADGVRSCVEIFGSLGILYNSEIRVYSLYTGSCLGVICSLEEAEITGVCHTLLRSHLTGFYTSSDLFLIQRSQKSVTKDDRELLDGCTFQSDAVRLAFIDKIKTSVSSTSPASALEKLKENWLQMTGKLPSSRLVETVEPFLREYWSLENLLQNSLDKPEIIPQLKQLSARDMVHHLLDPRSHISRSSRQAQLLLLSHSHPQDVLEGVLSNLDLGSDELSTSQQQKWQCILTAENADVAMNCDIAVPLFEQICNLLFIQKPDQLMVFLRRGQQVCDQKVGVSAFIRRRQTLQVYERALRCIPEPRYSADQEPAVFVTVHLLLTSEIEGSLLKAVRLLLKYKKWPEALDLLQQQKNTVSKTYMILYQIILTALNENGVLPQFSCQIFAMMPSIKSCEQFSEITSEKADEEVFCSETNNVSVDQIRPHLIKHMADNDS